MKNRPRLPALLALANSPAFVAAAAKLPPVDIPALVSLCTPPAENCNPSGASEGAHGQGACIPRYQLEYRDTVALNGQFGADVVETGYSAADALVVLRSLLGLGIPAVTVTVLP